MILGNKCYTLYLYSNTYSTTNWLVWCLLVGRSTIILSTRVLVVVVVHQEHIQNCNVAMRSNIRSRHITRSNRNKNFNVYVDKAEKIIFLKKLRITRSHIRRREHNIFDRTSFSVRPSPVSIDKW
jgi:hypothetical protein